MYKHQSSNHQKPSLAIEKSPLHLLRQSARTHLQGGEKKNLVKKVTTNMTYRLNKFRGEKKIPSDVNYLLCTCTCSLNNLRICSMRMF